MKAKNIELNKELSPIQKAIYGTDDSIPTIGMGTWLTFDVGHNTKKILERTTVQSFDFRVLKYINKNYPEMALSVLVSENYDPLKNLDDLGFHPDIYSPNYKYLNKEDLELLKQKKIKIIPWTVNSYSDIAKILNLDVDGIISDYPERVLEIKKKYEKI